MKQFPGVLERVGQNHRRVLSGEQREWLMRWYPVTENKRLAKAMGCSLTTLRSFVLEMGLTKSEEGIRAIRKRRDKAAARTNERNGCYDRKRGHPCSEATMAGNRRRHEEERLGLRENPQLRMKREDPERYKAWMEKRSMERKESIRKEKMRMMYGLERQTKLRAVALCPYKRSQIHHRHNAVRRGYVLSEDYSEGNPDRYTIFYDKDTRRSEKFEQNLIKDGFVVEEWSENVKLNKINAIRLAM